MQKIKSIKLIRESLINKQIDLSLYVLRFSKNKFHKLLHNPLCYPDSYGEVLQDFLYKDCFCENKIFVKKFNLFTYIFKIYIKSEIRFIFRIFELICLPLIALFFNHPKNHNNNIAKIHTAYLTENQLTPEKLIKYFSNNKELSKYDQLYLEAFQYKSTICSYLKSRRFSRDKRIISIFSSNSLLLSLFGIGIFVSQNIYLKLMIIFILISKKELITFHIAAFSKLWSTTHLVSALSPFNSLHNINFFSNKKTEYYLWMEGHYQNWSTLKALSFYDNITLFWINPPAKTTYTNLAIFNSFPNKILGDINLRTIKNYYLRRVMKPKIIDLKTNFSIEEFFLNKKVLIALGHGFDEIKDTNILFNYFKNQKTEVLVRLHPHFLNKYYEWIRDNYPVLIEMHKNSFSTQNAIEESDIIFSTLDSVSTTSLKENKYVLPVISTKYITYMNLLEFNPLVGFIGKKNKINFGYWHKIEI